MNRFDMWIKKIIVRHREEFIGVSQRELCGEKHESRVEQKSGVIC